MALRLATASETVALERATMHAGVSSAELMRRAGEGAAMEIAAIPEARETGVLVFAGSGNNGGDGWIAAASLALSGHSVRVVESGAARSPETQEARQKALDAGVVAGHAAESGEGVIVDALLGTGATGAPRGEIALAIAEIGCRRDAGATVVAIDLPSGVDATTGDHDGAVTADLTVSFGTLKRGHLLARAMCGEIVVVDIGLRDTDRMARLPEVVDAAWMRERLPRIPIAAHKGTRRRLGIIGGGKGMAGAVILAGEGALRSGIGLLRIVAWSGNALPVHATIPAAIFEEWPDAPDDLARLCASVDAIAIGPGLGATAEARDLVERVLLAWPGPVVLDADAINVFAGDVGALSTLLGGRPAVITPHPAELARLLGVSTDAVAGERFEVGVEASRALGAAVLLKGSPTVVFAPSGERFVSASGTAALATGGSGDVLTGMVGTLLAQSCDTPGATGPGARSPAESAACAAFVHGRAAELCGEVRGTTLDDILRAMPAAWNEPVVRHREGVLARLRFYS